MVVDMKCDWSTCLDALLEHDLPVEDIRGAGDRYLHVEENRLAMTE